MDSKRIEILKDFVTDNRWGQLERVAESRSRYLTVVLEDLYQAQNASAVLRSCDCFGVQDVHIIENRNRFNVHRDIAMGSSKWLTLKKYSDEENNTREALQSLKRDGYRIIATTPHRDDVTLEEFDVTKGKCALVFGTELTGISDIVAEEADEFMRIPMYGFTESFNISVSASLVMHHLSHKMRNSDIDWRLPEEDKNSLLLDWLRLSVKRAELIEDKYDKGPDYGGGK